MIRARSLLGTLLLGLGLAATPALSAPPGPDFSAMPDQVAQFGNPDAPRHLIIRAAADIAFFTPVIEAFLASRPDSSITWEDWTTNALHSRVQAECTVGIASADLVFSSAADLQVELVNAGCAQPYRSPQTSALPPARNWRDELFGITEEAAVMVFNRRTFPGGAIPQNRFELLDLMRASPELDGRIATYDIGASGVGNLFAFQDSLQASTFGSLLESFGRADVVATCCSVGIVEMIREGRFLVGYNILGSYAYAVARDDPDIEIVLPSDYTLVLHRAAFIPKAALESELAGAFIDFTLSADGRQVLEQEGLIVSSWPDLPGSPIKGEVPAGRLRPIELTPALRLGLDNMKHAAFTRSWNARIKTSPRITLP
ncbi:MAG: ABC transporter substrate-binding protein [Paracoccus sp. (in: a-proteobacteria)]